MAECHKSVLATDCPQCSRRIGLAAKTGVILRHNKLLESTKCPGSGTMPTGKTYPYSRTVSKNAAGHRAIILRSGIPDRKNLDRPEEAVCPVCGLRAGLARRRDMFLHHNNPDGKQCDGTAQSAVGLEHFPLDKQRHIRERLQRTLEGVELQRQGKRNYRMSMIEGLCPVCRQWRRLTIKHRIRRHGTRQADCAGTGAEPERTRPIGAWKKKRRKPNDGTSADG